MNIVMKTFKSIAIYPAVGVARIGNSEEYYLASELPGIAPSPQGGYKDVTGNVKKQVPLFRLYSLDEYGKVIEEITGEHATITWTVHLANRKAAWYQFNNAMDLGAESIPSTLRNGQLKDEQRRTLTIDPGPRSISGVNIQGPGYKLDGSFQGVPVNLGEIRTDDQGRLMVFGGSGKSVSIKGSPAITFANNDDWYDDISDGTVRAGITISGQVFEAEPAVIVCTPPNYAPGLFPPVTMYDVVYDLHLRQGWLMAPAQVNFYRDVLPLLQRLSSTQWVNEGFFMLFGAQSPSDFTDPKLIAKLGDISPSAAAGRQRVFEWFRDPASSKYEPTRIPPHYGDLFGDYEGFPAVDLSVTTTQYDNLRKWAAGDFVTGHPITAKPFDQLTAAEQAEALLKAPLEECLGGPFHPGIEITWPFRVARMWMKPFRLKILADDQPVLDDYGPMLTPEVALAAGGPLDGSGPGSLTRWLGVPWQTDSASCLSGYDLTLYLPLPSFWSVRVPNQVLSIESYQRVAAQSLPEGQRFKHFAYRVDWLRDFSTNYITRINRMVAAWDQLGMITEHSVLSAVRLLPDAVFAETGRIVPSGGDPSFQQVIAVETIAQTALDTETQKMTGGAMPLMVELTELVPADSVRPDRSLKRHEL